MGRAENHYWKGWLVLYPMVLWFCKPCPKVVTGPVVMEFRFMVNTLLLVTPLGPFNVLICFCFLGPLGPLGLSLPGGSGKILLICFCDLL